VRHPCLVWFGVSSQLIAGAQDEFTTSKLLDVVRRGAHRDGNAILSMPGLQEFMCSAFGIDAGDSRLMTRVDVVHHAFDPHHTGRASLIAILLGLGQCLAPEPSEQVCIC